jgi:APA family basic amino acid/polyamine antiporter
VFKLRRTEKDLPRPFRVPLYPVVPVVFLLGAIALLVGACSEMTGSAWFAFGIMGLGIPLSFVATTLARRRIAE